MSQTSAHSFIRFTAHSLRALLIVLSVTGLGAAGATLFSALYADAQGPAAQIDTIVSDHGLTGEVAALLTRDRTAIDG